MRFLVMATALALAACGSDGDEPSSADSAAVLPMMTMADSTIETDTVKVAGDTAR